MSHAVKASEFKYRTMDREISKEEKLKKKRKVWIQTAVWIAISVAVVSGLVSLLGASVDRRQLIFASIDRGEIELSVSASGTVVPAFEEIINSPINTRILQVYRRSGDSVDVGTPLLQLDLQTTETAYRKLLDEKKMKEYQLEQLRVNNSTYLSDLEIKVKISRMALNRMEAELRNERYLDSLGSGTTDLVRQAELACNTGKLELEQLEQMYRNGQQVKEADLKVKELEYEIFKKELDEMKRTLDDAQIRSPRKATLTFINSQIGAQVSQGEQVAVISDLSHFKVEGEIADVYGDRIAAGNRAVVKIGREELAGTVVRVTPLSKNGVIAFTVQLEEDSHPRLRSGLETDVHVMNAVKDDVLRLKNGSYYSGPGDYHLFVMTDEDHLERRTVRLGDSSFEYVEVVNGLEIGDRVVISGMKEYQNKKRIRIK